MTKKNILYCHSLEASRLNGLQFLIHERNCREQSVQMKNMSKAFSTYIMALKGQTVHGVSIFDDCNIGVCQPNWDLMPMRGDRLMVLGHSTICIFMEEVMKVMAFIYSILCSSCVSISELRMHSFTPYFLDLLIFRKNTLFYFSWLVF